MKAGIIFPMPRELGKLGEGLEHERVYCYDFYHGRLAGAEVDIAVSGVGKANSAAVTEMLLSRCAPDCLIVCGVAGGIARSLAIGDTVVCTRTAHHDLPEDMIEGEKENNIPHLPSIWMNAGEELVAAARRAFAEPPHAGRILYGAVVSGEVFVERDGRDKIIEKFDPLAADMETAAAAQVCFAHKTPFTALRSITDTGEQCGLEVYRANLATATENSRLALLALLAQL